MIIGYARVSTLDQNPDMQRSELDDAGCEEVIVHRMSGTFEQRPGFLNVKGRLRKGDTLEILPLDRLGPTSHDLIERVQCARAKAFP